MLDARNVPPVHCKSFLCGGIYRPRSRGTDQGEAAPRPVTEQEDQTLKCYKHTQGTRLKPSTRRITTGVRIMSFPPDPAVVLFHSSPVIPYSSLFASVILLSNRYNGPLLLHCRLAGVDSY